MWLRQGGFEDLRIFNSLALQVQMCKSWLLHRKLTGGKAIFVAPFCSLKTLNAADPNMSESDLAAAPLPSINAQEIRIFF